MGRVFLCCIITNSVPPPWSLNELTMKAMTTYSCGYCDTHTNFNEIEMSAHFSRKHQICWTAANPCMQKFRSRNELAKHWIWTSHIYYCPICDGGHRSKTDYANHTCTRKDAGIKCPVCEMVAPTQEVYDKHWEDTAQDSRHFRCNRCRRRFDDENNLKMVGLVTSGSQ